MGFILFILNYGMKNVVIYFQQLREGWSMGKYIEVYLKDNDGWTPPFCGQCQTVVKLLKKKVYNT